MAKNKINAKHGGPGKKLSYSEIRAEAARLYREANGELSGFRVPKDAPPAARELADAALIRIRDVAEGRVGFRLAPSTLRAAIAIRDEVCGPVSQALEVKGTLTLEALVSAAAAKAREMKLAAAIEAPALPPAATPEAEDEP